MPSPVRRARRWIIRFAVHVLAGGELVDAIENWRKAKTLQNPLPAPQTSKLVAAVFRRFVRYGFVAVLLAVLPTTLLIWQNLLIRSQNEFLKRQTRFFERQIRQEAVQDYRGRRAELLKTLYGTKACAGHEDGMDELHHVPKGSKRKWKDNKGGCYAAAARARAEAFQALVGIEAAIRRSRSDEWPGVSLPNSVQLPHASAPGAWAPDVELRGADLSDADLQGAKLGRADLSDANLNWADLRGAKLNDADLQRTKLGRADLRGADLRGANLSEASLYEANLRDANLNGAELRDADLSKADLSEADLSEAHLRGAKFGGAKLRGAKFSGADLSEADLRRAYRPRGAFRPKVHLGGVDRRRVDLGGADRPSAHLGGFVFRVDEPVSGADLSGADLSGAKLNDADLGGADLSGAKLNDADLSDADLSGAKLNDADLSDADLFEATGIDCATATHALWLEPPIWPIGFVQECDVARLLNH